MASTPSKYLFSILLLLSLSEIALCWKRYTAAARSLSAIATDIFRGGSTESKYISKVVHDPKVDDELLAMEIDLCGGEIIDPHLHIAPWFDDAETLVDELQANNVSIGILYNPYPKAILPFDMNTYTATIARESKGKVYALASLNTTHNDWASHRQFEMNRLREDLKADCVLGTKLAPPHTCLPLVGPIMDDILTVVSESKQKLLAMHIGTTPFCGPLGKRFGIECNCGEDCVDPTLLVPKIEQYPEVTFVLLHSGHEFLPSDSEYYYDFKYSDECIKLAKTYHNVYLSISAIFAQDEEGMLKYPGGFEMVKRMKDAGITHKVFWGSDASYNRGEIRPVLVTAIKAMKEAGWTEEERAWALRGCVRQVFKIPA